MRKLARYSLVAAFGLAVALGGAAPALAVEAGNQAELLNAIQNVQKDKTITLTADIAMTDSNYAALVGAPDGTVIDGNGHTLTGLRTEGTGDRTNGNALSITNPAGKVTVKDITLRSLGNHALNLYGPGTVTLDNVTLDHTAALRGAPLIAGTGAQVVVDSNLTLKLGSKSWYGINVDVKKDQKAQAGITFGNNAQVTFDNAAAPKAALLVVDSDGKPADAKLASELVKGLDNIDYKFDDKGSVVEKATYTVTFAGEGVSVPAQTVTEGEKAAKPADPVRDGYVFKGWFAQDASAAYDFSAAVDGNVTLTAQWEKAPEVVTNVSMYRLYNQWTGEHFYTASATEHDVLVSVGWTDEGIGWIAPSTSKTPVYRLYNPYVKGGDHHYTTDVDEYNALKELGWKQEGIGWYSDDAKGVELYRQYNPFAETGTHNYTSDKNENDTLVKLGWKAEGTAWYGVKVDDSQN